MTAKRRFWPRSLRSRLLLILLAGLIAAHGLSFGLLALERRMAAERMMADWLGRDVAMAAALLDSLPPEERALWPPLLAQRTHVYDLGPGAAEVEAAASGAVEARRAQIEALIRSALDPRFPLRVEPLKGGEAFQARLTLQDGAPLTVRLTPQVMPLAAWLPWALGLQLLLLGLCGFLAVRAAVGPLARLAAAAEALEPDGKTPGPAPDLAEEGAEEAVRAATAFNAMRARVSRRAEERTRLLAAVSHDLQTPIARMKLRAEIGEETPERGKLLQDLAEIEHLVRQGLAYARALHGEAEAAVPVEICAFAESLVFDYQDMGAPVRLGARFKGAIRTRPRALRRILTNLIDNALKFAGAAELEIEAAEGGLILRVCDRGPGLPEDRLEAALRPFSRLEDPQGETTPGAGLGLAIAQELAQAMEGDLILRNRPGGGLCAELRLRPPHERAPALRR